MSPAGTRILLTVDAVGGVWQYGLDLARGLAARGAEPILVLLGPEPDAGQRAELAALRNVRLVETGLPLDWLSDGPAPVRAAADAVASLARRLDVDLVQLNMPTLASADFDVPTMAVTHGCVSTWWAAARPDEPLAADYRWHHQLMVEGLHAADLLVAPSASYAATVARHYGLATPPVVVRNGRDPLPAPARAADDRVLTVGRLWDGVKRAALLDRVASRLCVPFEAAGAVTGPHGERAVLDHLAPLGQLDTPALAHRLAARPIFVSAASFEPFGLAVLEAAHAGCALVLSDIPTFRELWDDAALFVPLDDEDQFVAAIRALLDDPAERIRLGQAARVRAARYTPDQTADAMLALYAGLLAPRSGRIAA